MSNSSLDVKPLVTFDFDDTLACRRWDKDDECFVHMHDNFVLIDLIRDLIANDFRVMIVTSRHRTLQSAKEIDDFIKKHNLDVRVKFTNGKFKFSLLMAFNSIMHWDDDPIEVLKARNMGIFCVLVPPPVGCDE